MVQVAVPPMEKIGELFAAIITSAFPEVVDGTVTVNDEQAVVQVFPVAEDGACAVVHVPLAVPPPESGRLAVDESV
jgi:hypothetical protein